MPIEPTTRIFLDSLTGRDCEPLHGMTPQSARQLIREIQSGYSSKEAVESEELTIDEGPAGKVKVHIIRPCGDPLRLPAVMYFHGGGWILGDRDTYDRLICEIAIGAGASVLFVEFDRSPEVKYPVAIEQAYAVTKFVVENAKSLNLDASRLVVAGDGTGGNMAAAVTLMAKRRNSPRIGFQVLLYPVVDPNVEDDARGDPSDRLWHSRDVLQWFWDCYLPDPNLRRESTAAPLCAAIDELRGLPPALVVTAEHDLCRDGGEQYARKLAKAGVTVTAVRYLDTMHDFMSFDGLADTPAARAAMAQVKEALRFYFDSQ